ncbi:MAG: putative cupredoxin-like copper-binding protein [Verrucomicrobiales bacterium]|jgi:uncharacterized cupredoxin-like copper-binding protein
MKILSRLLFSVSLLASPAFAEPIKIDFGNSDLNGWKIESGESIFRNGGLAAAIPAGEDGEHPTFLAHSPMFRLNESGELAVTLTGGRGGGIPTSSRALPAKSVNNGAMGVALRRVTDDAWVLVAQMPQNGGRATLKFSQAQLSKLLTSAHDEVYTLDFFDAGHGGWGHAELVSATIPGKLIDPLPAPPDGFEKARPLFLGATHGRLAFDKTELYATPGSPLALTLFNSDEMAHNWVLCQPGKTVADELGKYVMDNIIAMTDAQFIPKDPRILSHSTLVAPGTSDTQFFKAPTEPGDYPIVCTFPGHHITMRGILHVQAKLPLPKPSQIKQVKPVDEFDLIVKNAPVLQRGPLRGGGPAVICVGTPEGVHFAFDTGLCTISRVWTADSGTPFLNTKSAWGGRGGQALDSRGKVGFQTAKPTPLGESRFRSYELPESGIPIFEFTVGDAKFRVRIEPGAEQLLAHFETDAKTVRTWKLENGQSIGESVEPDSEVEVSGKFTVRYDLSN